MISSQKGSFIKAYKEGKNFIPILKTWPADLETPLSTWLKLSTKDSHGVFLESVEGGENLGRWSIVATNPCLLYTSPSPRDLSTSRMPSSA